MVYPVLLGLIIVLNVFLAFFILAKDHKNHIYISFASFIITVVLWMATNYLSNQYRSYTLAFTINKVIFFIAPYISFALLYFSLVFPHRLFGISLKRVLVWLLIPVFVSNLLTVLNLVITKVTFLSGGGTGVVFGPGVFFFALQFITYFVFSVIFLTKSYIRSKGYERSQLQYLLFGISITMIVGLLANFAIPLLFNTFTTTNYGPFSTIAVVLFTAYAILRHKLLDIRLIVARTVAYTILIFTVALFYTAAIFYVSNSFLNTNIQEAQGVLYAILTLFIAFTYQPLKNLIQKITDKVFFKNKYSSQELLARLTKIMATTIQLEMLTKEVLHVLLETIHISKGSFLIFQQGGIYPPISEGFDVGVQFPIEKVILLSKYQKNLFLNEEENYEIIQTMRELNISTAFPIISSNKLHGMLILGEKKSGEVYSEQDTRVLGIFVTEVAVAIENAKSYEEIKRFNITLRSEVEKATKELKAANTRLQELDKLKDEFVSLASHELRTPMTAVKSYLLLLKDNNTLDEKGKLYMDHAYEATTRLINLVNDMLNVSRIESGRMVLNMSLINIDKLIDDVINEILPAAQKQGINLNFLKPNEVYPQVQIDPDKIKEVLINLIGNSIKFTPSGGTISVSLSHKDGMVAVSVSDSGKGIRPEDQDKLFKKFGLIEKNYDPNKMIPGTGLGLYITKNIIQLHGGKIDFYSEGENKGSTFTFTLRPVFLNTTQQEPILDQPATL